MPIEEKKIDEQTEQWLRQFAQLIIPIAIRDVKRNKKLEKFPDGYYMDDEVGRYECFICSRYFEAKDIWYDKYGYKCRDCYANVLKGVISKTLSKKRDLWCADWQVSDILKIHPATRDKLVRQKKLVAKELVDLSGKTYFKLFLKSQNNFEKIKSELELSRAKLVS